MKKLKSTIKRQDVELKYKQNEINALKARLGQPLKKPIIENIQSLSSFDNLSPKKLKKRGKKTCSSLMKVAEASEDDEIMISKPIKA